MNRTFAFLAVGVCLALAPISYADETVFSSGGTGGSQSVVNDFFTQSGFNGGIVNSGVNGGNTFSQIPFSLTIAGINATGNSIASATLSLGSSGGPAGSSVSRLSVSEVSNNCFFGCNFAPSQITASVGFEGVDFTSIQSGAMTANIVGGPSGNFDLLDLGFGPELLAGDAVTVNGTATLNEGIFINSFGFNAITQFQTSASGVFSANGTLTENLVSNTPEPASLTLLATGLLAIGAMSVLKLR